MNKEILRRYFRIEVALSVVIIVILFVGIFSGYFSSSYIAIKELEKRGYSNIQITNKKIFSIKLTGVTIKVTAVCNNSLGKRFVVYVFVNLPLREAKTQMNEYPRSCTTLLTSVIKGFFKMIYY